MKHQIGVFLFNRNTIHETLNCSEQVVMQEKVFQCSDGSSIVYYEKGEGPSIIFIHGFTLDHRMRKYQYEEFSKTHHVIIYDLRGFGKSDLPNTSKQYSHSDDLKELLEHVGIENTTLIGLSMGGMIAIDFTLQYPQKVQKLILIDTHIRGYRNSDETSFSFKHIRDTAKNNSIYKAKELWIQHPFFDQTRNNNTALKVLLPIIHEYSGRHRTHHNKSYYYYPEALDHIHTISIPVYILVGEKDIDDFLNIASLLESQINGAQLHVVPQTGHLPVIEDSEFCNTLIKKFILNSK